MINEPLDHLRLAVTVVVVCFVAAAVFAFYYPVREATVNHLDSVVDMQARESRVTVDYIDRQVISGAEAKQFCIRYHNSNIVRVPAPGSITDLRGLYSVSVNYNAEPVSVAFTPAAFVDLY